MATDVEEWKPMPGCSRYEVSSLGRARGPRGLLTPDRNGKVYVVADGKHATTRSLRKLVRELFGEQQPEAQQPEAQQPEEWRRCGAGVARYYEVSDRGRVRMRSSQRIVEPDEHGRVKMSGELRLLSTLMRVVWGTKEEPETATLVDDAPEPRRPSEAAKTLQVSAFASPPLGPTSLAVLLSAARGAAHGIDRHRGNETDRREPFSPADVEAWREQQPERLAAWVHACRVLEANIQRGCDHVARRWENWAPKDDDCIAAPAFRIPEGVRQP